MSKHENQNRRETFANRPEGRVRREDRTKARAAKQAFAYMGGV